MATTIPTTGYFDDNPGRQVCVTSTGQLWAVFVEGSSYVFYYSDDDGATWTEDTGAEITPTTGAGSTGIAMFIDVDDMIHVVYNDQNDNAWLKGGTISGSAITWTITPTIIVSGTNFGLGADVIAFKDGNTKRVIAAASDNVNFMYVRAFTVSGGIYDTSGGGAIFSATQSNAFSLDFTHTGDYKTLSGTARFALARYKSDPGAAVLFKMFTWNGSGWTVGADRTLATSPIGPATVRFDGTRWLIGYNTINGWKLWERDAADTATTARHPTSSGQADSSVVVTGIAVDHAKNVYYSNIGTSNHPHYAKLDRATLTWDAAATLIEAEAASVGVDLVASTSKILATWTTGGTTERIEYLLGLNTAPSAPTIDSPADGSAQWVLDSLTIDWTFNDPDPGDTQSAYSLRKREGAGAFEYWNGTTWQATEDASTKIVTSGTAVQLDGGWGADSDPDHYYSVKTWDAADAGPSSWSSEARVIPSDMDIATFTNPTNLDTVDAVETATWTVATQTKYRIVVSNTSSSSDMEAGTLEFDSGVQVSSSTSHVIEFPTNSVTRYVRLITWNDEGLASDIIEIQVSVSYVPPSTPTISVTADDAADTIDVDITNPGAGATETYNDIYRRVVGDAGDGIRVGTNVAIDGTFTDRTPASGINYQYRAKVFGDNNTSAFSTWTA